ncbi:MAG: type II toxin-antitoxin system VapC family toxin [Solirubrobacteraceae bacterium]
MTPFADSSAVVKRYADEEDADRVRRAGMLVISELALIEVPAALWRKHRVGELPADAARVLSAALADDVAADHLVVVRVSSTIVADAARLVAVHPLRAYDAVQLATALAVRAADPDCTTFACFDAQLMRAAVAEGFAPLA